LVFNSGTKQQKDHPSTPFTRLTLLNFRYETLISVKCVPFAVNVHFIRNYL